METPYEVVLEEKIGTDYVHMVKLHEGFSEEAQAVVEEEDDEEEEELARRYEALSAAEVVTVLDGETWTYGRLQEGRSLEGRRYYEVEASLGRERNRVLGECFLELIDVRKRMAEIYGYDSYVEFAFESVYGRDYTPGDIEALYEYVKKEIIPLNNDIWGLELDYGSYDELDKLEGRGTGKLLEAAAACMEKTEPALGGMPL